MRSPLASYETDVARRPEEQAALLRAGHYAEVDIANLAEEIESSGREQRHALRSSDRVLATHLLKGQFQAQRRSRSSQARIVRERGNIADREGDNRSLAVQADRLLIGAYAVARAGGALAS